MNSISKSLLALGLGALIANAGAAEDGKKIDIKDLPADVAAAVSKQGDVKEVRQQTLDGKTVYRAQVKVGDRTENVWIDEKGGVIKDMDKAADKAEKAADKAERTADKAEREADKAQDKANREVDEAEQAAEKAKKEAEQAADKAKKEAERSGDN